MTLTILPETGIRENLTWRTDIMTTINGTESRMSLRRYPRRSLTMNFRSVNQEERRDLWDVLNNELSLPGIQPIYPYTSRATQSVLSGQTRIFFDPEQVQLQVGVPVVIFNSETKQIQSTYTGSIYSDGCDIVDPLSSDIDEGWFIIKGGVFLIANQANISWQYVTGSFSTSMTNFEELPLVRDNSPQDLTTLDGIYILEKTFIDRTSEVFEYPREVFDNNIGKPEVYTRWNHSRINGNKRFKFNRLGWKQGESDIDYWMTFFDSVRGAWKPFLLSTQLSDLTLVSPPTQNGTSITVDQNQSEPLWSYDTFRYIEILYLDGTKSHHRIDSSSGGQINISPNIPDDPKVSDVIRVSYMLKTRMDDQVQIQHTHLESVISMSVKTTDDG